MAAVFLKLVNLSISASWLVLAVLVLRLISKRSPKWMNVLLWGIVALRLVLPVGRLSVIVLILPIRRLPVLRWELSAVLLILPVWILPWMLRRNLPAVLWILPVWILSRILRRNLSAILLILPVRILSRILRRNLPVILGWILLIRLCRIWILRNISGAVWILICGRCFLVHIFIFR